jgi:2-polyprenyl-6-methoxyphenol hydroxylase-like FAD-dependent oxidoreductase
MSSKKHLLTSYVRPRPRLILLVHDCTSENPEDWDWMMMQTWHSEDDTGLKGKNKEEIKLETWYKMGKEFGPPFDEVFATMDPKSTIWHNRLAYWPTKPWDGKGEITLAGDAAHPMTFRKKFQFISQYSLQVSVLEYQIILTHPRSRPRSQ